MVSTYRDQFSVLSSFEQLRSRDPSRVLFTFVNEAGRDVESMTVDQLARAAEGVAWSLRGWGVAPGDRVMLVYPPSLDFVQALLGCLAVGVVPVPVYPPNPLRPGRNLAGFSATATNSGARAVLTNTSFDRMRVLGAARSRLGPRSARWPSIPWHRTDNLPSTGHNAFQWHVPAGPDEPVLLQYTSGSTTEPRGVVITHGNLRHEVTQNARDLGLGDDTIGVFWVPQYHDLGLISVIFSTLAGNGHSYLMSPLTFLRRPDTWFDVMSRVKATHTAAPNFAYELATRRTTAEMRREWDLSAMRVVMSAGEPIHPGTVERFLGAFAQSKLNSDTFYGAYGLAEHTVSVTMGGRGTLRVQREALQNNDVVLTDEDATPGSVTYFSCGQVTKPDARVLIVDPDTQRSCSPGHVGEVWVDSTTKALGYHGLASETRRTFQATVDAGGGRTFLRTGDLGFFHAGELYITGRIKDLIILNGRNVYPQDLEHSVRDCHRLIRPGGVAAFSVCRDQGEAAQTDNAVVLFLETRQKRLSTDEQEQILLAARRRLTQDHQVSCHAIVLGRPGLVLKTTSGKVRRQACREAFLAGSTVRAATTIRTWSLDDSATAAVLGS